MRRRLLQFTLQLNAALCVSNRRLAPLVHPNSVTTMDEVRLPPSLAGKHQAQRLLYQV